MTFLEACIRKQSQAMMALLNQWEFSGGKLYWYWSIGLTLYHLQGYISVLIFSTKLPGDVNTFYHYMTSNYTNVYTAVHGLS